MFNRIYEFAAQLLLQLARITLFFHYQKLFDRIVIEIQNFREYRSRLDAIRSGRYSWEKVIRDLDAKEMSE